MTEQPPGYPFPEDEILYPRRDSWEDFDLHQDSYFALGRPPEEHEHTFDGREHHNSLRLVIRTPEKGSMAMLCNHGDMQHLSVLSLLGTLESQEEVYEDVEGREDASISLDWLASMMGEDAEEVFQ